MTGHEDNTAGEVPSPAQRARAAVVLAGHTGDDAAVRAALGDDDPRTRAAAVGALARLGALTLDDLHAALGDPAPAVRNRVAVVLADPALDRPADALAGLLDDPAWEVTEAAAWACGERWGDDGGDDAAVAAPDGVLDRLVVLARSHTEPLCREAAVAALGAIGHPDGFEVILEATSDKPAIRRRAVLALAPYLDRTEARAALERASEDRDWQVRDAAALLLDDPDGPDEVPD